MRLHQRFSVHVTLIIMGAVCVLSGTAAWAKDPPSDLCSLLTPDQLQKTLGQAFGAAEKGTWPPPFAGQPSGTSCGYSAKNQHSKVTFIAYVDPSAAQAKQNFDKLSMWFPAKSKPAIGDAAYIDTGGAIHVLKGRVRYYVKLEWSGGSSDKAVQDLASLVATEI